MEELFKRLGLEYIVNPNQYETFDIITPLWILTAPLFINSNIAGLNATIGNWTPSTSIQLNQTVLTTNAQNELEINGEPIITKKDLDILKEQIRQLTEKLNETVS